MNLWRTIEEIPGLVREGAIIPLKDMEPFDNSTDNPQKLMGKIFPGENGSFTLWEDAGDTPEDLEENWASTVFFKTTEPEGTVFEIQPVQGNRSVVPKERTWTLEFCQTVDAGARIFVGDKERKAPSEHKDEIRGFCIVLEDIPVNEKIRVVFPEVLQEFAPTPAEEIYPVLERSQISYNLKADILNLVQEHGKNAVGSLCAMDLDPALFGCLCEILTAVK